jgi:hypothetical protein
MSTQTFKSILLFVSFLAVVTCEGETTTFLDCSKAEGFPSKCVLYHRGTNPSDPGDLIIRNILVNQDIPNTLWILNEKESANPTDPSFENHVDIEAFDMNSLLNGDARTRDFGHCSTCFEDTECFHRAESIQFYGFGNNAPAHGALMNVLVCKLNRENVGRFTSFPGQNDVFDVTKECPDAHFKVHTTAALGNAGGHLAIGFVPDCKGQFKLVKLESSTFPIVSAICKESTVKYILNPSGKSQELAEENVLARDFGQLRCSDPDGLVGHVVADLENSEGEKERGGYLKQNGITSQTYNQERNRNRNRIRV